MLVKLKKLRVFLILSSKLKTLESLRIFLGMEVVKTESGLCMSQRKYCLELLCEFGMIESKSMATSLEPVIVLDSIEYDNDHFLADISGYQKLVGKLIYLTMTRPDISYSDGCLSQYMHSSTESHVKATLRVIRYFKGTQGAGILM
ncbi:uncharacterized mitochondrial protein AtMg00810-like [Rutidosis leptorrhynchoides]|uniref:uncharacterized mitochondrial protein AtMg00810-like n=1 Tax=Rutidosis leptorrhynchoides TaxID=125765 RepID=UPI003A998C48